MTYIRVPSVLNATPVALKSCELTENSPLCTAVLISYASMMTGPASPVSETASTISSLPSDVSKTPLFVKLPFTCKILDGVTVAVAPMVNAEVEALSLKVTVLSSAMIVKSPNALSPIILPPNDFEVSPGSPSSMVPVVY